MIAHELTHVINRDVMVMTLASFFATLAAMIAHFAFFFGGGYGRSNEEEEAIMIVILVSVAVYAISFLLLRALSRYREFAADRGSAILTGPAQRAGVGADQDQRRDRAGPQRRPAPGRRHERLLHRARARKKPR